jgi:hypothetical protein
MGHCVFQHTPLVGAKSAALKLPLTVATRILTDKLLQEVLDSGHIITWNQIHPRSPSLYVTWFAYMQP